jgi:hypothetical protein
MTQGFFVFLIRSIYIVFAEPENRIQSNIGMELMPLVPLKKAISSDDRISIFCVSGATQLDVRQN